VARAPYNETIPATAKTPPAIVATRVIEDVRRSGVAVDEVLRGVSSVGGAVIVG
jgi:hypothetical protein